MRWWAAAVFVAATALPAPLTAAVPASPADAAIALSGELVQGGWARGVVPRGATGTTLDGKPVDVAADGSFLIGFDRDARTTPAFCVAGRWPQLCAPHRAARLEDRACRRADAPARHAERGIPAPPRCRTGPIVAARGDRRAKRRAAVRFICRRSFVRPVRSQRALGHARAYHFRAWTSRNYRHAIRGAGRWRGDPRRRRAVQYVKAPPLMRDHGMGLNSYSIARKSLSNKVIGCGRGRSSAVSA